MAELGSDQSINNDECQPLLDNQLEKDNCDPDHRADIPDDNCNKTRIFTFILMMTVVLMSHLGFSLLGPFFTIEALSKDLNEWETGFIFSVYEIPSFAFSLLFGKFLPDIGSKFLMVSGVLVLAVTLSLFGTLIFCSGMTFLALGIILRLFQGMASAAVDTAVYTVVINQYEKNMTTMLGLMEISYGIADMVGPVLGGLLYQAGGFKMPFIVVGAFTFVMGLFLWIVLPAIHDEEDGSNSNFLPLFAMPTMWFGVLSIVANMICLSFLDLTLAQHLDQFNVTPGQKGGIFAVASLIEIISAPIIGRIVDRKGFEMSIMMIGAIVSGVAMITIGPPPVLMQNSYLWMIIFALSIFGLGIVAQLVVPFPYMLGVAKKNGYAMNVQTQALISGIAAACFPLGSFIGPFVGGFIVDSIGFYWSYSLLGIMQFTLGITFMLYFARKGTIACINTLRHDNNRQESVEPSSSSYKEP